LPECRLYHRLEGLIALLLLRLIGRLAFLAFGRHDRCAWVDYLWRGACSRAEVYREFGYGDDSGAGTAKTNGTTTACVTEAWDPNGQVHKWGLRPAAGRAAKMCWEAFWVALRSIPWLARVAIEV